MNVYGITNCDTVKEARAWLAQRGVSHRFVDFKKVPPTRDQLAAWCAAAGWQTLLNRRGTTWKKLEPEAQAKVVDTDVRDRGDGGQSHCHPSAGGGVVRRDPRGLRSERVGSHVPGVVQEAAMAHTPSSILFSLLGILVSGLCGGVAGWALVQLFGLAGVPAALLAAVVGMVVATGVWVGVTVVLRALGMVR